MTVDGWLHFVGAVPLDNKYQANHPNTISKYGQHVMHSPAVPGICRCTLVNPLSKHLKKVMRVVLDMAEGLNGHKITCDNFFTLNTLGEELVKRKVTMLGRVRKNKPELASELLAMKNREGK